MTKGEGILRKMKKAPTKSELLMGAKDGFIRYSSTFESPNLIS
jgi:hypothetical protein